MENRKVERNSNDLAVWRIRAHTEGRVFDLAVRKPLKQNKTTEMVIVRDPSVIQVPGGLKKLQEV